MLVGVQYKIITTMERPRKHKNQRVRACVRACARARVRVCVSARPTQTDILLL